MEKISNKGSNRSLKILAKLFNKKIYGILEIFFGGFVFVFFLIVTYEDVRIRGITGAIIFWLGTAFFAFLLMLDGFLNYFRERSKQKHAP